MSEIARDKAATAAGEVRPEGVTRRDPLFSRAIVASDRPKFSASGAVKRKARLLPPKSTVIRGRGNQPIRLANGSFASATRTGLTLWTDPSVVVTLGPVRASCLGAAIQSKGCAETFGSCTCTANVE